MIKRTTIAIDQELLERARQVLGARTARVTVEEALRRAAEAAEGELAERAFRQRGYLERLSSRIDAHVLASEDAWR